VGAVAPVAPLGGGALKDPAGEVVQVVEPASEEKVPALQGRHWEEEVAPFCKDAVPGGQEMQPEEVCPLDGLKVPLGQVRQEDREVEEGALLKVPMGQGMQEERPGVSA
jgi:hypothetical protein